jgi:hypothetical protein
MQPSRPVTNRNLLKAAHLTEESIPGMFAISLPRSGHSGSSGLASKVDSGPLGYRLPQNPDGSFALPFGKLERELTVEQGYVAARMTSLSILRGLKRTLGDLDKITAWSRVFGMVR